MACDLCGRTHENQEQAQRCAAYEVMLDHIPLIDPPELLQRPAERREVERLGLVRQQRLPSRRVQRRWRDDDPPDFEGGIRVPRRPRRPSGFSGLKKELPRMDRNRFQSFEATWIAEAENSPLNEGWKKAG